MFNMYIYSFNYKPYKHECLYSNFDMFKLSHLWVHPVTLYTHPDISMVIFTMKNFIQHLYKYQMPFLFYFFSLPKYLLHIIFENVYESCNHIIHLVFLRYLYKQYLFEICFKAYNNIAYNWSRFTIKQSSK